MRHEFGLAIAMGLTLTAVTAARAQQAPAPTFPQTIPAFNQQRPAFNQQGAPGFVQQRPEFNQQVPYFPQSYTTQQPLSIPQIIGLDSNGMPLMGVPRFQVPLIQPSYYTRQPYGTTNGVGMRSQPGQGYYPGSGYPQYRPPFVQNPYSFPDGRPFSNTPR